MWVFCARSVLVDQERERGVGVFMRGIRISVNVYDAGQERILA